MRIKNQQPCEADAVESIALDHQVPVPVDSVGLPGKSKQSMGSNVQKLAVGHSHPVGRPDEQADHPNVVELAAVDGHVVSPVHLDCRLRSPAIPVNTPT